MKNLKIILLLLLITTSFTSSAPIHFSGKLFSNDPNISNQLTGLYLYVVADGKFIAGVNTQVSGDYKIDFTNDGQHNFDFFITGLGIDTSFVGTYTKFENENNTWDIKIPLAHAKKLGKVVCPKCHTTGKVYPIVYGWAQMQKIKVVNCDTTYSNIVNKNYYAQTCISSYLSPQWYCGRDKIKF